MALRIPVLERCGIGFQLFKSTAIVCAAIITTPTKEHPTTTCRISGAGNAESLSRFHAYTS